MEGKLNNHLEQLKYWLVKRGYKEDDIDSEIETVKLVRTVLFQKRNKKVDHGITCLFLGIIQH